MHATTLSIFVWGNYVPSKGWSNCRKGGRKHGRIPGMDTSLQA
jgi:hypothetical protein